MVRISLDGTTKSSLIIYDYDTQNVISTSFKRPLKVNSIEDITNPKEQAIRKAFCLSTDVKIEWCISEFHHDKQLERYCDVVFWRIK